MMLNFSAAEYAVPSEKAPRLPRANRHNGTTCQRARRHVEARNEGVAGQAISSVSINSCADRNLK